MSDRAEAGTRDGSHSEAGAHSDADASAVTGGSGGTGPLREVGVGLGIAVVGFAAYVLWFFVFSSFGVAAIGELSEIERSILNPPALALGMLTGAAIYFRNSAHDVSFLDVRVPSARELLYAVGGLLGLLGLNLGADRLYRYFDVPAPEHGTVELLSTADPIVIAYFVAVSILLIGPAEELLFRNVIQKRFEQYFSTGRAIVLASLVFAVVHFTAYLTTDPTQLVASLATVLLLSLLLGWIYYRTRNLVVVALSHGSYNAVLFATLYLERTAWIGLS